MVWWPRLLATGLWKTARCRGPEEPFKPQTVVDPLGFSLKKGPLPGPCLLVEGEDPFFCRPFPDLHDGPGLGEPHTWGGVEGLVEPFQNFLRNGVGPEVADVPAGKEGPVDRRFLRFAKGRGPSGGVRHKAPPPSPPPGGPGRGALPRGPGGLPPGPAAPPPPASPPGRGGRGGFRRKAFQKPFLEPSQGVEGHEEDQGVRPGEGEGGVVPRGHGEAPGKPPVGEGRPRAERAPTALVTPGTTSKGMPARLKAKASSPPRPKTMGSPPLSRATTRPSRARAMSLAVMASWGVFPP